MILRDAPIRPSMTPPPRWIEADEGTRARATPLRAQDAPSGWKATRSRASASLRLHIGCRRQASQDGRMRVGCSAACNMRGGLDSLPLQMPTRLRQKTTCHLSRAQRRTHETSSFCRQQPSFHDFGLLEVRTRYPAEAPLVAPRCDSWRVRYVPPTHLQTPSRKGDKSIHRRHSVPRRHMPATTPTRPDATPPPRPSDNPPIITRALACLAPIPPNGQRRAFPPIHQPPPATSMIDSRTKEKPRVEAIITR